MKTAPRGNSNQLLKAERELRGWSQKYVADQIGADYYYLSRWERGTTVPSPYYRQKLCTLFGKSARELGLLRESAPPVQEAESHEQESHPDDSEAENATQKGPMLARQLSDQELRTDFSLGVEQPANNNLPAQLTSLIGRERDVTVACNLLLRPDVRLLTLTGTGGVGKTRLALQVATQLLEDFTDGVFFVSLAPISDPSFVISTIAHSFDLRKAGNLSSLEYLKAYLREKCLLLLLDNFEHVVAAAPLLIELLQTCPRLKILVTSRAVLRVSGEQEFSVPALALPDLNHLPEIEVLTQYAAVALFLQRARAIKPNFQLTSVNAHAIADICTRLDGLPLAIELAAAWIKLFSPQALLARLNRRLLILTSGRRDMPVRQQALRNTIAWSYDLLSIYEQRLFRRICVFKGGCTLAAVEAVVQAVSNDGAIDILEGVELLLDKSLLQQSEQVDGEPRLTVLETVREYGLECLTANAETEEIQHAHAEYYLALVEEIEPQLGGPQQIAGMEQLEREHDNIRAALQWSLEWGKAGQGMEMALRFGGALRRFWALHGHHSEGQIFLEQALIGSEGVVASVRAKALSTAAHLALEKGNYEQGKVLAEQSFILYRNIEDPRGIAFSLHLLERIARTRGDYRIARTLIEASLLLWRKMGDKERIAWSLFRLARQDEERGEYARARLLFEENLTIFEELENKEGIAWTFFRLAELLFISQDDPMMIDALLEKSRLLMREVGDKEGIALCFCLSGRLALERGDVVIAHSLIENSLAVVRQSGHKESIAESLKFLADVTACRGDYAAARALYEDSLTILKEVGMAGPIASCLEGAAGVAVAEGELRWAVQLLCEAGVLREAIGVPIPPIECAGYERSVVTLRSQLGEGAFSVAWTEGRAMTLEAKQGELLIAERSERV